jgi:AcrR family transcriptional regulator
MNKRPVRLKPAVQPVALAETKDRILDAAERLFAERGIEGVSIRDIIRVAEVNLAAINYHFGTKQALASAVFSRRLGPLNERQLALLDAAEKKANRQPLKLEVILEALIRPPVEAGLNPPGGSTVFMRLMGRFFSEPNAEIQPLIRSLMRDLRQRFDAAFFRAVPRLSEEDLFWRINFIIGTLHHSLLTCGKPDFLPVKLRKNLNADAFVKRLVAFNAAGFRNFQPVS